MRRKGMAIATTAGLLLLGLVAGCAPKNEYREPPPPEVIVDRPLRRPVTTSIEYTGTTKAVAQVNLRARVKGFLKEKLFKENDPVEKDQLILVIDEAPFQATLDQAKAALSEAEASVKKAEKSQMVAISTAQLALSRASLLLSRVEETRQQNLTNRGAGSREELDRTQANLKKSEAQVESDLASLEQSKADFDINILAAKASVAKAQADVTSATINLSYCRISSPITGRISRVLVDVGNLVGDGEATLLAVVLQEDPIYAYVAISEADLQMFRKKVRDGTRPDFRKDTIPIDLALADEVGFPHKGKVQYADPSVDPATGTVTARGIFDNPADSEGNRFLFPGSFVRLRVPKDNIPDAILLPERAIGNDQKGLFVYVVDDQNKVRRQDIVGGTVIDETEITGTSPSGSGVLPTRYRVIEQGLNGDELIIVNGLQRARSGLTVKPIDAAEASKAKPKNEATSKTTTTTQL
jgi:RND family efflux transporter MFP subunit